MMESCDREHNEIECIVGPPTHGLIPLQTVNQQEHLSDYDTASSVSSTSITPHAETANQNTLCCGITKQRLKEVFKVKKKYLPSKLAYYSVYSSRAIFNTYYILFLTSAGLDPEQAGLIQGMRMVVLIMSSVFWGVLADRSKKYSLIMLFELCAFGMFVFAKPWVAYWITNVESTYEHREHIQDAVKKLIDVHQNSTSALIDIMGNTNHDISQKFNLEWHPSHYQSGSTPLFLSMLGLGIASAFLGGGLQILLDTRVIHIAKTLSKNKNTYGRQRLWGSVAYAITPVVCGIILETVPVNTVSRLMPIFYLHFAAIIASVSSCYFLFRQKLPEELLIPTTEPQDEQEQIGIIKLLKRILRNPHLVIFLFIILMMGLGNGIQWCFMFIYMDELNASKTTMGFCVMSQCATEAIIFPIASKIIHKIGGNKITFTFGILGYAVAFFIFQAVKTPALLIAVTTILGVSFSLFYVASMDELYKAGNPKCMTSLYALYNSILCGLGNGLAGIVGGIIYKNKGPKTLFLVASIFFAVVALLNFIYTLSYNNKIRKNLKTSMNTDRAYVKFLDLKSKTSFVQLELVIAEKSHQRKESEDDAISIFENDDNVL